MLAVAQAAPSATQQKPAAPAAPLAKQGVHLPAQVAPTRPQPGQPVTATAAGVTVPRHVLVLYDGNAGNAEQDNFFRNRLAVVANYHGLLPLYHDVGTRPLPDDKRMASVAGIITVFETQVGHRPDELLAWQLRQLKAGRRMAVFGEIGSMPPPDALAMPGVDANELLALLGLAATGTPYGDLRKLRYHTRLRPLVDFERQLPDLPLPLLPFASAPSAEVWLSVARSDGKGQPSPYIGFGPGGGFAFTGSFLWESPNGKAQWHMDPFTFLEKALALGTTPVPTPTTLNGYRVAFSHVDADGFGGFTELDKQANCATILRDHIFKRYGFPVTVSVIQAEVDPRIGGKAGLEDIARTLFLLPNVEPGTHSYSHPFWWDPEDEAKAKLYKEKFNYDIYGFPVAGYTFSLNTEIVASARYITERLSPKGKPCRVIQWSGSCDPTETALRVADEAGILNINGGDTYTDAVMPSLTTVSGLVNPVGKRMQVYTGQANENILTNLWTGPFHGYRDIIEAMRFTESPRRLMPINMYYHFYSAEKHASLRALQDVHEWVMQQDIAPLFTSQYLEMVRDWTLTRLTRNAAGHITVRDYGTCLAVRLPEGTPPPDIAASENVIGYAATATGLYVHLAPGHKQATIVPATAATRPVPHIRYASGHVSAVQRNAHNLTLRYDGTGKGRITLAGLPPDTATTTTVAGQPRALTVQPDGTLQLVDVPPAATVELALP